MRKTGVSWNVIQNAGKNDPAHYKEMLFSDLYSECRQAPPGARLPHWLRIRLERLSVEERKEIVTRTKDGCAPLFIACKKGNVDIVEFLITQCFADVEQRGTYEVPDDRSIHYVTPLWCAAVAGKLLVVQCLVEHGACVNSVSDTGSTPVRSACFMTHFDIVKYLVEREADILKPNYNGGTCLINSVQSAQLCEFLIMHGASVNAQDIQQKTALHYAIQEHRFGTTRLFLDNGADPMIKNRYGDDALQTACLKGSKAIFSFLIEEVEYDKERIAEAHELIGSTFLDEQHDLPAALEHWRKALDIRFENPDKVLAKHSLASRKKAYLHASEFITREELENFALDLDAMRVQSLLICERILGPLHKDMIFRLMYRGAAYADSLQYQRCIDLWRYALELRIQKDSLLHSEACFTAQALVRLYLDLLVKHNAGIIHESVQYDDVIETIELLARQFNESTDLLKIHPVFKRQQDTFDKILKVITHLFYILNAIPKVSQQIFEMKCLLNRILRMHPVNSNGDSLLHLSVSCSNTLKSSTFFEDPQANIFPCADVASLLLECGANVDDTNDNLSTSLHLACTTANYNPEVVKLLLDFGAHIDQRNSEGIQPHMLLAAIPDCTINPLHYISLKCLAAQKIVKLNLNYHGEIPLMLEDFVKLH